MGNGQVLSDAMKELVDVVCTVLCAVLHTDDFKTICWFGCASPTVDDLRSLKLDALQLTCPCHLLPRELERFCLAPHLSEHIVHVDIGLVTLALRHRVKGVLDAGLGGLGGLRVQRCAARECAIKEKDYR